MLMLDTLTTAGVRGDGGLRGNEAAFGTNMLMMMASRPLEEEVASTCERCLRLSP